jgi:hemerythrin-like domain-containing protein
MQEPTRPSQVRHAILDDHRWLRELLADVEEVARRVGEGDHALADRLRQRARAMRERFLGHLALEERYLVPALRETDAFGDERARLLLREHTDQRHRFEALLADLGNARHGIQDVARRVRRLVSDLRMDMEHEEKTLLDENLLRDDPVVVDEEPE